jgi:hypothetical protein
MPRRTRKDCFDDIAGKTGVKREDVQDALDEIFNRAEGYEYDGMRRDDAYDRARDEFLAQAAADYAKARRGAIMDMRLESSRHRDYDKAEKEISELSPRHVETAPRLAMEAKISGVNLPFWRSRDSVDSRYNGYHNLWLGGFADDLRRTGMMKLFASRQLEANWVDELFQLSRGAEGKPGITKDAQALAIAKTIQKWQKNSMSTLNRLGAWIRSYTGYVTRTSHDPDLIRVAGPEKWINDTLPLLDLKRTFGTRDPAAAREALFHMWNSMKSGDHFDYGQPRDEPLYPNIAKRASASRELHFKDGKSWREYNEKYGAANPTETVVAAFVTNARRAALMAEFGTKPREAYERDKAWQLGKLQRADDALTSKLHALETALSSPAADAAAKAKIESEMTELRERIKATSGRFEDLKNWIEGLDNRFAQVDGTSKKPVNRARAQRLANWMAFQRLSKLGNIFATHFASLISKPLEARHWGVSWEKRYASVFRGFGVGAEGSERRQMLDMTLALSENALGHNLQAYDAADTPAGWISRNEARFWDLTGVSRVIDRQRADLEVVFAQQLGLYRGKSFEEVGRKESRILHLFGIGPAEWKALNSVEWTEIGGRTLLYPSDAMKLNDDQVRSYIDEAHPPGTGLTHTPEDIGLARENLALKLVTAYTDRSGYGIPAPGARIRAMLFGKHYAPGSKWNVALKLFWQFKLWPADVITRAWERQIYGTIGDGALDRFGGIAEMAVGAVIFGVLAEGLRDLIKGEDPLAKIRNHPIAAVAAGAQRSGMGSIVGDFLLGQFDRHGLSAAANMLGPTFGQIDDLAELLHAGESSAPGTLSASAMKERAATALKMVKNNTPFMNLWLTHQATDAIIWHRLQEAINPGYLQRSEQRQKQLQGTEFLVTPWGSMAPSRIDRAIMGR